MVTHGVSGCVCVCVSLTLQVRSASGHEQLDGLDLGQVPMLVLLLRVAVRPVVQMRYYIRGSDRPTLGRGLTKCMNALITLSPRLPFICEGDIWLFQITKP